MLANVGTPCLCLGVTLLTYTGRAVAESHEHSCGLITDPHCGSRVVLHGSNAACPHTALIAPSVTPAQVSHICPITAPVRGVLFMQRPQAGI